MTGILGRYFGLRFLGALAAVLGGVFALVLLVDYVEMMRRYSDVQNISAARVALTSLYRVPQVAERILPFCILIAAMSSYLALSRRLELVIARAAGMSAWQFTAPAVILALTVGAFATAIYNPLAANLNERSKRLEAEISGQQEAGLQQAGVGSWVRQRSVEGSSIINAQTSREQGVQLSGVTVFTFDKAGQFLDRVEAKSARLEPGFWRLEEARVYALGAPPVERETYMLATNLSAEQVRETFSTAETVPFWQLPAMIDMADRAGLQAVAYKLQYYKLIARPFMLAARVMLAAAFSLRFFRFGGVQKMVLGGVASGFLLYVMSKITDDLSKAELMHPIVAAWLPVSVGGLTGFVALLYQEDG